MNEKDEVLFYKEWLPLPKDQFRVLQYLTMNGTFCGNLSVLLRKLHLSTQQKNRDKLKESIELLTTNEMIESTHSGNTYTLKIIPKDTELYLPCEWITVIMNTKFSKSVAHEVVIKILLWFWDNGTSEFNDIDIEKALNIKEGTIGAAKKVLKEDFQLLSLHSQPLKLGNCYYGKKQFAAVAVWLNKN